MATNAVPEDIREFFKIAALSGPIYHLWVFDPETDKVVLTHNEGADALEARDHGDLAKLVQHPERVHGYAYRIRDGWRITDWEHKPLNDPHILQQVVESLSESSKVSHVASRLYDPR